MTPEKRVLSTLALLALVAAACGQSSTRASEQVRVEATTTSVGKTSDSKATGATPSFECPVTVPPQPGFAPPAPYPDTYPYAHRVWYGNSELWTALPVDGDFGPTKMPLWWSVNFPGGRKEPHPDVLVNWTRLDSEQPLDIDDQGWTTNFHTPETGWAMMAGTYPSDKDENDIFADGCWKVEGTYKAATLSYVFEVTGSVTDSNPRHP